MREASFIQRNRPRWEAFEKIVHQPQSAPPDQLAELFIQNGLVVEQAYDSFSDRPLRRASSEMMLVARKE